MAISGLTKPLSLCRSVFFDLVKWIGNTTAPLYMYQIIFIAGKVGSNTDEISPLFLDLGERSGFYCGLR